MIKCSLSCNPLVITKKVISKWKAIECIEQLVDGQCCSGSALFYSSDFDSLTMEY